MHDTSGHGVRRTRELTLDLCRGDRDGATEAVTETLLACPGVTQVHVDHGVTWALVTFDEDLTSPDAIVAHLVRAGRPVSVTRLFDPADVDLG